MWILFILPFLIHLVIIAVVLILGFYIARYAVQNFA